MFISKDLLYTASTADNLGTSPGQWKTRKAMLFHICSPLMIQFPLEALDNIGSLQTNKGFFYIFFCDLGGQMKKFIRVLVF